MIIKSAVTAGLSALMAIGAVGAAQAGTITFDSPVITGATMAPGVWYTDRYAPAGFATSGGKLIETISTGDSAANRPAAFSGAFFNTQGRTLDLDPGTTSLSIELLIDQSWANAQKRWAGMWGVGFDGTDVTSYPIIEFRNDGGTARFSVFDNDLGFIDMGLPTGFAFGNTYTLKVDLVGANFIATVGNLSQSITGADSTSIKSVILQGYNTDPSINYAIQWDNLTTASAITGPVPEPTVWAMLILGFGVIGGALRKMRARVLAFA